MWCAKCPTCSYNLQVSGSIVELRHCTIMIVLKNGLLAGLPEKKKRHSLQISDSSDESGLEDNQVCISFNWS